MPAYRAFEGFAKKVYSCAGLECEDGQQLGAFFECGSNTPVMKPEYSSLLDDETVKCLTSIYKLYSRNRHPYSHATENDYNTAIIQEREVAEELLWEVINQMKSWYSWIENK